MDDETYDALVMARKYVVAAVAQAKRHESLMAIGADIQQIDNLHFAVATIEADLAKLDAIIDAENQAMRQRDRLGSQAIVAPATEPPSFRRRVVNN